MKVVISAAKLRELVRERKTTCWVDSLRVELVMSDDFPAPPDPPQAKEFLPLKRRNSRK